MKQFFKSKKFFAITSGLVAVALIITAVCVFYPRKQTEPDKADTSVTESENDVVIEAPENNGETEENEPVGQIEDDGTGLTPSEPSITVPYNRTGEKADATAEAKQPVNSSNASSSVATPTYKQYVQDANPETGISWDGKSAIVYRYADGSETTEKRYGGYYEIRPDEWVLYARPLVKEEENNKCSHCEKVMGDGTNGTCVRWMMGDMTCPNCGVFVPANTCHTCGK